MSVNEKFKAVVIDDENAYIEIDGVKCYMDVLNVYNVENKLNELVEQVAKENKKYHDLFDKYWDLIKKLNKISNVIYRYNECELEEL